MSRQVGVPLISRVLNREEIYHGELLDQTPDLLLLPRDFAYVAFGESEFASNKLIGPTLGHTGHHRLEGIGALIGPHVQPGAILQNATLLDLAPTILHALGLPIPQDLDGRVLSEAFTSEFLSSSTPRYETESLARINYGTDYSEDEEAEVLERLSDLGYIS